MIPDTIIKELGITMNEDMDLGIEGHINAGGAFMKVTESGENNLTVERIVDVFFDDETHKIQLKSITVEYADYRDSCETLTREFQLSDGFFRLTGVGGDTKPFYVLVHGGNVGGGRAMEHPWHWIVIKLFYQWEYVTAAEKLRHWLWQKARKCHAN